jgi:hypothetical protein
MLSGCATARLLGMTKGCHAEICSSRSFLVRRPPGTRPDRQADSDQSSHVTPNEGTMRRTDSYSGVATPGGSLLAGYRNDETRETFELSKTLNSSTKKVMPP